MFVCFGHFFLAFFLLSMLFCPGTENDKAGHVLGQTNAEDCPGQERIEETGHTG